MVIVKEISMFGITEITLKHKNRKPGFIVRLLYVDQKPSISKEFHITESVNRVMALRDAVIFRDKELNKLIKEGKLSTNRMRINPSVCNVSGIVGVHKRSQSSKKDGLYYPSDTCAWTATWSCEKTGKTKTAHFSENKWGDKNAFLMAYACRDVRENIFVGLNEEVRQEYLNELFTLQEVQRILAKKINY
ncbi:MAG: hypothetical protein ACKUBY_00010 [Candidatus Moraniibacteriota bacterium]|jgi:hypothetical protein